MYARGGLHPPEGTHRGGGVTSTGNLRHHEAQPMSKKQTPDVLGALPHTRPHRRSQKRPAVSTGAAPDPPVAEARAGGGERASTAGRERSGGKRERSGGKRERSGGKRERSGGKRERSGGERAQQGRSRSAMASGTQAGSRSGTGPGRSSDTRTRETRSRTGTERERSSGKRLPQPPQPAGLPTASRGLTPPPPTGTEIIEITVRAAAELAEIGFVASAQALRNAVSRLPRP